MTPPLRILWRTTATTALVLGACGCTQVPADGGPLPQFTGAYQILEIADSPQADEVWPVLRRLTTVREWLTSVMPNRAVGTVVVTPRLGREYAEWSVHFDELDHEMRMIVGPRRTDGTFAVWRFEQTPAPEVRHDGTGFFEAGAFVAEFAFVRSNSSTVLRERWMLRGDRLEFALETRADARTPPRRVGGFIAERD